MPGRQHHRDSSAVRMARYINILQPQSIHERRNPVCGGLQGGVASGNSVGLTHVEQIESIDGRVPGEERNVVPPVSRRADQAMQLKERFAGARALKVQLCPVDRDVPLFDLDWTVQL